MEAQAQVRSYSAVEVASLTGVTYRQLDYWDRTRLAWPSIRPARGSGSQREYSEQDVARVRAIAYLLEAGLSLQAIRRAVHPYEQTTGEAFDALVASIERAREQLVAV